MLYIAPETLLNETLLVYLFEKCLISQIVLDESHCCVEASQDFRPKYKQLGILRDYFPDIPYTALTATANESDINEIAEILQLKENYNKFIHNLDRSNISYHVIKKTNETEQLERLLKSYPKNTCGLIYCNTKDKCQQVSNHINKLGYKSEFFYSTISKKEKRRIQEAFLKNEIDIVVATTAFGTGINKPNVRFVINSDIPSGMNDLVQQLGRGGRDGLPTDGYVFYSGQDVTKLKFILRQSITSPSRLNQAYRKLDLVVNYCRETQICRRQMLLHHYGQPMKVAFCDNCDICKRLKK